jgi:uncharacterized protein with PIN domain
LKAAYIDSSFLVAIEFAEPEAIALRRRIRRFEHLLSSNLLEAKLRAAFTREGQEGCGARALLMPLTYVRVRPE